MVPIVALIGRPNVGKSTLFNRLTDSQDALVADIPGVTRDRRYRLAEHSGCAYVVVDTGGVTQAHTEIERGLMSQTEQAIDEADALVLVLDAREGCLPSDLELHARLRCCGKPVVLAVNKAEGREVSWVLAEFAEMGTPALFAVSARRGSGVAALMDAVLEPLEMEVVPESSGSGARLAVIGRPNAGKSTLINRLLRDDRLIVSSEPGTTRDSIDVELEWQGRALTLVDTAGIRRKSRVESGSLEAFSVTQALRCVHRAQVVIAVIDATEGAVEQDAALIALALDAGRAVVVAFNKCDALDSASWRYAEGRLRRRLRFASYLPVVRTSGARGIGTRRLLREAMVLYDAASRSFSTPQINDFLARAMEQNPPPRSRNRRVHVRYGHQGGNHPLCLVLHGSRLDQIPGAYRRYLASRFRQAWHLPGIPIELVCRASPRRKVSD